jgi:outer membrane murein-binding lipoprotein Lpp|tara:strand:- start:243 stop:704 length:462 start_codon:yes stop_codon:yes gene_type:complete
MGMKLAGVMALLMFVMGGVFYWYYNDTQERLSILNANNAKLEVAVQISEDAVTSLQESYAKANEELTKVNTEFTAIRQQNRVLSDKLGRHDIGNLAENKPGLVERVINGASIKAGRCFELLSGAPLTDKEKEAENGKSFNSECPWLFDNYSSN